MHFSIHGVRKSAHFHRCQWSQVYPFLRLFPIPSWFKWFYTLSLYKFTAPRQKIGYTPSFSSINLYFEVIWLHMFLFWSHLYPRSCTGPTSSIVLLEDTFLSLFCLLTSNMFCTTDMYVLLSANVNVNS